MEQLKQFAEGLPRLVKETGRPEGEADNVILKAGSLRMILNEGSVRHITAGRTEVIRNIYAAVRDKEWLTLPPAITDLKIDQSSDSFRVSYRSRYQSGEIDFTAEYLIIGSSDSSLSFKMKGEALTTFLKNRIGFCVLNPVEECAGKPCTIIHTGGSGENSSFPEYISPHQPFRDVRSMQWQVSGLNCFLDFEGDIFETEDQRNWTDASFKTYCTPLERPFPVIMKKGEQISQRIILRVTADIDVPETDDGTISITIDHNIRFPVPAIGIGRSTRTEPITANEIGIIRNLKFDHYRVDLYLFDPDWKAVAEVAAAETEMLGYSVELALFFDDHAQEQCNELISCLKQIKVKIALILLLHKTATAIQDELTGTLTPILKEAFPGVRIASGTNANFAQLNRNRPQSAMTDFLCYSIHPQEHASDITTLTENLKGQEYTVKSALHFPHGRGIWVSPVNIQRRFNANIQNFETPYSGSGMPPQVDSRLMSLFGACWCAGSLKYLFESDIAGVTFFETVGERGIIQGDYPSRWPHKFPVVKGMIFPLFHILKFVLENRSFRIIRSVSAAPLKADLLMLTNGTELKAMAFNYTSEDQVVSLDFCRDLLIISQLDVLTYPESVTSSGWLSEKVKIPMESTLQLKPFSVTFIEARLKE